MTALPDTATLDLETEGHWLTVWFNSPENRNALSGERAGELLTLCTALAENDTIRGITFRGRGAIFCAGGDLKGFGKMLSGGGDRDEIVALSREAGSLFDAIDALPQLTVMAIEGAAMAGGMGLACCGDVVLATADAKFGLSEVRLGLSPAQIAPFVMRRLGPAPARRLMLTGARLDATTAHASGLLDAVFTDAAGLDAAIDDLREQIAGCAPQALAATKELIRALPALGRQAQIEAAAQNFADRLTSEEAREGVSAFIAKRKPVWSSVGAGTTSPEAGKE